MEIKFFAQDKVLDLSGQKISVSENNSRISDKMFTKYVFPFEIVMDEAFKKTFDDYASDDALGLEKVINGQFLFENKYHEARLEILSAVGDLLTVQIDYGFEDLPNFEKALKDLPLEKFPVEDIHTYAAGIAGKKYPQTNFNFPRLYYGKYSPEDKVWDAYNGFINDISSDGTELRRNYIDETGEIFNVNIIHPLPHILYLLKAGFEDAGFELEGDILTEPMLAQGWVFSGTEYFSRLTQRRLGLQLSVMEYNETFQIPPFHYPVGVYDRSIIVAKPGSYKMRGYIRLGTYQSGFRPSKGTFYLNEVKIYECQSDVNKDVYFDLNLEIATPDSTLRFKGVRSYGIGDQEIFVHADVFSKDIYENEEVGEDNGVITNLNEIDLSRAVPEITFGELVNRIRNFLNYDVTSKNNVVYMNRIADPASIEDVQKFEVLNPQKNFLNKKSFLIQMPEWEDGEKPDSVFYDGEVTVNKKSAEGTTVIETNTYALPVYVAKPQGPLTAVVKSYGDTLLQLVKYDGKTDTQNNAKGFAELSFPALFYSNWEKWLRQRLRSVEYSWMFDCTADDFNLDLHDYIFCYNNVHIIKELVKDYHGQSMTVNITTETVR